eukprot:1058752-Amphidinium_carterae.1
MENDARFVTFTLACFGLLAELLFALVAFGAAPPQHGILSQLNMHQEAADIGDENSVVEALGMIAEVA